jgi:hypothetical protein
MPESDRSRPAHLQLLAVSWNFGWPIAAGVVLGHWIDEKLGTSPAATLLIGIGSMAASTWRLVTLSRKEAAERGDEDGAHGEAPAGRGLPAKSQRWDEESGEWVEDDGDSGKRAP